LGRVVIHGGERLSGEVEISGSKNASLPCIIATLLTDEPCVLYNVPQLEDVKTICSLLKVLGKKIEFKKNTIFVKPGDDLHPFAPYELVSKMRASMLVMGPLLIRTKRAKVSLPGGCAIGSRPINLHLQGLTQLGADISLEEGYVILTADKLSGTKIVFDFPSVGATENLLMVASLTEGKTVIENAACEPEIVDLVNFLNQMGARIKGAGTRTVEIFGVSKLQGTEHTVIPDRIETGTFLLAGLITGGKIILRKVIPEHLEVILAKLSEAGAKIKPNGQSISISSDKELKPIDIETLPYPGFPTDMQAQWMALMSVAKGKSVIRETIFENRFLHVGELQRMGAKIEVKGNTAIVEGVKHLSGAPVKATDLRASAALLLAGLIAEGKTEINEIYHLERGYENIISKLRNLGARIRKIKN
jgi:UDP-N-acetylglucosamine 1-carboxyvinyltransferase